MVRQYKHKLLQVLYATLGAGLLIFLSGCQPYQLRGKVVPGKHSAVLVVNRNDERFNQSGMGFATIEFMIDPDKLSRKTLGPIGADWDGQFAIRIDELGAGFLEYDIAITARLSGFAPATGLIKLPGPGKELLIMLAPGNDRSVPRRRDILEETLKMSERYLYD